MRSLLRLLMIFVCHCESIDLQIYNNSVFYGAANQIIPLNKLDYIITVDSNQYLEFSAKMEGTINWPTNIDKYFFHCNWDSKIFGFVWIDDHIICANGVYKDPVFAFWNLTWTSSAYKTRKSFIRINIYSQLQSGNMSNNTVEIPFSIQWSIDNNITYTSINNTYLSSDIPLLQQNRLSLQDNLINNTWSPWYMNNILTTIHLPDSFGFTIGGCTSITDCQMNAIVENNNLTVGAKSIDLKNSYFEYNFTYKGYIFQYQYATIIDRTDGEDMISNLYVLIKSINKKTAFVGVNTRFYWNRYGTVQKDNSNHNKCGSVTVTPYGLDKIWYLCSNKNVSGYIESIDALIFGVTSDEPIYFTTDITIKDIEEIETIINNAEIAEYSTYDKYGNLSTTKLAIQAGLMWNIIYSPEESVIAPVSRAWSGPSFPNQWDFDFILFDWDNIFASYMLSFDAINISISNLIQIIKAKTVHGFVPNYKTVNYPYIESSEDRTEPPIGAHVLYQIYLKYGNSVQWVIQLLFDDLYDWNNWFWLRRRCNPKKLICLGSDPTPPSFGKPQNLMQGARWESGLDNSPMYDGNFYDNITHHMLLYDVGFNAMVANEMIALMNLAKIINKTDILDILNKRYQFLINGLLNYLWNDTYKLFINRRSDTDDFYVRISPTLFYPLLTGEVSIENAELMVNKYLLNAEYFCINENFPINQSEACYYGLPSIAYSDPSFSNGYWRGLTWGPMAQLVWWSLDMYSNQSIIIKNGQIALEKQMNAMMLKIWNNKRHICENYGPSSNHTECTGTTFYHWGGLTGFISLIHPYYY